MAFEVIPMPGGGTEYDDAPQITVYSSSIERPVLTIKYVAGEFRKGEPQLYGEIKFSGVLEYRWAAFEFHYSPYENDDEIGGFKLIRVLDSQWIETMAAKGWFQNYPGQRFGPYLEESKVKHYRLTFDDYGVFDVIALHIEIREFRE